MRKKHLVKDLTLGFLASAGLIYVLIQAFSINPFLFSPRVFFFESVTSDPLFTVATFLKKAVPSEAATFEYRGDGLRHGVIDSEIRLPLKPKIVIPDLNVGIHSASKSSPAVDDSGIYVGTDSSFIHKFDFEGKKIWSYFTNKSARGIHGTASLDEKSVFIGSYNGYFYRLDKNTGEPLWITKMLSATGCSPFFHEKSLFICSENRNNGYLAKLNRETGEVEWKTPYLGEQIHSSPTLDLRENQVYLGTNRGDFYAFDLKSAALNWKYSADHPIKGTSVMYKDDVCFTSWNTHFICVDRKTGAERIKYPIEGRSQSSPALLEEEGLMFFFGGTNKDGILFAFDLKKKSPRWTQRMSGIRTSSSPTLTRNKLGKYTLFANCSDHSICALDPLNGKILWKDTQGYQISSVPKVHNNRLLVAYDEGPLIIYE